MYWLRKNGTALVSIATVFALFSGCRERVSEDNLQSFDLSDPDKRIQIILRVEDAYYDNGEFEGSLRRLVGEESRSLDEVSLSRLLDDFVEDKLLLAAARKRDLSLSWEEQKLFLSQSASGTLPDGQGGEQEEGETESLYERLLVEKYIYENVKDLDVDEDEILDYYDQNKRQFLQPERISVSQILLDNEEKAVEVYDRVKDGDARRFQELAEELSQGVEAPRGGYLGIFSMNQLPSEMEKVVFSLREGQISQVVESAYGFHIFRLNEKLPPELKTLEEATPDIRMYLLEQKINGFVEQHILELKDTLDWEFFPGNLSFPYERNSHE